VEELDDGALVIGDNPNGPGEVSIRISEGMIVSASAQRTAEDYRDNDVILNPGKSGIGSEHIKNRNNWDHNKLGNTQSEIEQTITKVIQNPDEVYETTGGESARYIKELEVDGDTVIVMLILQKVGEGVWQVVTGYVPVGDEPAGSDYEDVYDRWEVVSNIKDNIEEDQDTFEKIKEGKEIISEWDIGDLIW
jgi:hypothetical protein